MAAPPRDDLTARKGGEPRPRRDAAAADELRNPERVAMDLLQIVAHIERKALHSGAADGWQTASREWVLDTYAECLRAVLEPDSR
jgi:hypothetical protein